MTGSHEAPAPQKTRTTISLPAKIVDRADDVMNQQGRTRSEFLRGCLKTIVILSEAEESTFNEAGRPIQLTPDRPVLLRTEGLIRHPLRDTMLRYIEECEFGGSEHGTRRFFD